MHNAEQNTGASGFACPRCGGALWVRHDGESTSFECRIGDAFSAMQLWIEHCAARNEALLEAARHLAENAALARELAAWANERGDARAAARLAEEANYEARGYEQVRRLLDGLETEDEKTTG